MNILGVTKTFPGVVALDSVTLDIYRGEVHAIVGVNGAGKSTLIKIISGALEPDSGTVLINGERLFPFKPEIARAKGISTIYQEFHLIPFLTVAENILLGSEPLWINRRKELEKARVISKEIGIELPLSKKARFLTVGEQQLVEIAKALARSASVLIMDEPTSALSLSERERLFAIIQKLRTRGVTVVYITHHLDEVFRLADRVTVLRDGRLVATKNISEVSKEDVITMMVGRKLTQMFPKKESTIGHAILEVKNLSSGKVHNISFKLHKGEILGVYGVMGAGQEDLCKALFGVAKYTGEIYVHGIPLSLKHPSIAVRNALGYIPSDRKTEGLALSLSIKQNLSLPSLHKMHYLGIIREKEEVKACQTVATNLAIRAASLDIPACTLSGGNQQKVIIGKWLLTGPEILICNEPTRGIDVGAKAEIYHLLINLAKEGVAIIIASSDLQEILGISDRILVIANGKIVAEFTRQEATEEKLLAAALQRPFYGEVNDVVRNEEIKQTT